MEWGRTETDEVPLRRHLRIIQSFDKMTVTQDNTVSILAFGFREVPHSHWLSAAWMDGWKQSLVASISFIFS